MHKGNVISEADMCDAAKRLVNKGLPTRVDSSLESQFSAEALEANKVKLEKKDKPAVLPDLPAEEDSDDGLSLAELAAKLRKQVRCTVSVLVE